MGTYSRLFIPIFLIIAVVVGLRYTLLIESESASEQARYQSESQQFATWLATTLAPAALHGKAADMAAQLAKAANLNGDVAMIRWEDGAGQRRALAARPLGELRYPAWLENLAGMQADYYLVPLPPSEGGGLLELWFQPARPLARVWQTLRQQALISALNIVIIYALLGLLIFANHRMLRRLARATSAFRNGQHDVRMHVGGSLEARALATTFNDMAERVQGLLQSLQSEKERIEVTLASIGEAVITTDLEGRIVSLNEAAQALTGWPASRARGRELHAVLVLANSFGQRTLLKTMADICAGGGVVKAQNQSLRHSSGVHFNVEYSAAPIRKASGEGRGEMQGAVLVLRDVSEKRNLLQQMTWQSQHDVLTGLPNRNALAARFEQELAQAREDHSLLAVCLFDLDHFQQVNERGGQGLGDDILKQVASRLHDFAMPRHYAARLGGDEFVLLLPGQGSRAAVEEIMLQLMAVLGRGYRCQTQTVSISASAGVALYEGNEISADNLLRHADQALYQAKVRGRGTVHFFDADLDQQVRTHHNRRTEVREALEAGELLLYYQPKMDMRQGRIFGMEALLRWRHPKRGIVGPLDFLPIVEHTELIADIGEWVMRQALRQLDAWRREGREWMVSVNVAAYHLQRADFVERLQSILAEFPAVPPQRLELEILESSALRDLAHVRATILACQQLGVSFALDDFGTGYSSMSYLKRLPANVLKIDQGFVRNMLEDRDDLHLVNAVIGLARAFGRGVIAEGVETVAHGALLMRLGCDLAQGYGIARPMPGEAVGAWADGFVVSPEWQAAAQLPPLSNLHEIGGAPANQLALFSPG
ncbi:putative bifunctional diguanylate cyclase/phosphodiesterase [Pseudoduganella violacea]|uniref:Diguanylate cyclase (GGDEF)-like protein/PAS domain S-box-containing protein n=1 Tax=Pseudoduganella violacea TaxID=1715466 RepID=A0A7W5BA08_9BURK|nr:GGDEF domain-containing phosphodiesterase [Pseudoduganella violacea]MBB3119178.1 diguanylate cyclase (GGDEF)-like protein/PAS domain S-box-containing protein [Pseudoduganella violacea]